MKRRTASWIVIGLAIGICVLLMSNACVDNRPYKTVTLRGKLASFSFEYNSRFRIKEKGTLENMAYVVLNGPFIKAVKDYTSITVSPCIPNKVLTNALDMTNAAERNASSFMDCKLMDRRVFTLSGYTAYRLDYQERNIDPVDRGLDQPKIDVYRGVRFDTPGLTWFIQMRSDSTVAETDKPDFEHILETFKILD